jgi:TupA-like ATPgrasp
MYCHGYRPNVDSFKPTSIALLRPSNLSEMKSTAEQLSDGMDFVRVDLYDLGDRVVLGELTNYPESGNAGFHPDEWDLMFGSYWLIGPRDTGTSH